MPMKCASLLPRSMKFPISQPGSRIVASAGMPKACDSLVDGGPKYGEG